LDKLHLFKVPTRFLKFWTAKSCAVNSISIEFPVW